MSSSSVPAAKRRRVDAANDTLRKPFRSPLVKQPQTQPGKELTSASPATPTPAQRCDDIDTDRLSTPSNRPSLRRPRPGLLSSPAPPRPGSNPGTPQLSDQQAAPRPDQLADKDKELLDQLSRRRKKAELKAREAERELELVRQAARIQSGKQTSNEELAELVRRWKGACRIAAEELFDLIRERVDSMGGGEAWRKTRRHYGGWSKHETAEEKTKRTPDGEESDEREELEGSEEVAKSDHENEERDFTMHMMLKSLNIDPEVVGYDPVEDKWRD